MCERFHRWLSIVPLLRDSWWQHQNLLENSPICGSGTIIWASVITHPGFWLPSSSKICRSAISFISCLKFTLRLASNINLLPTNGLLWRKGTDKLTGFSLFLDQKFQSEGNFTRARKMPSNKVMSGCRRLWDRHDPDLQGVIYNYIILMVLVRCFFLGIRCQRLACVFCLIFLTMLTNIMW